MPTEQVNNPSGDTAMTIKAHGCERNSTSHRPGTEWKKEKRRSSRPPAIWSLSACASIAQVLADFVQRVPFD
ncbi:hypothetical protein BDV40DRAFT_257765 [Aspergillus tamarii]|uniref:Uncharacterized protein n=1 Tax=Aspergillus tamarii TaxID=41984 RepID=A0A5N6V4X3_ASPTM|nr:hypothetical protein BDV40DRAFT_257765 [Aspergillus tamarii]